MSRREQLIDLLVARTSATRERLQRESTEELEKALDRSLLVGIRKEAQNTPEAIKRQQEIDAINEDRIWARFFFSHPEIRDSVANRKMIFEYALSLSDDGVVAFEHLDETAKTLPGLDRQKVKQLLTAANIKQDQETLYDFCRANKLESNAAALNLLRQEFGAGFDSVQVGNALQSGLIVLGPASREQLQRWSQEDQAEYQDFLVNQATPEQLREITNTEAEQRRIQFQREETERQIAARAKIDATQGYAPLPDTTSEGIKIDAMFLKNLKTDIYRNYLRRYGATAITARLNGIQ